MKRIYLSVLATFLFAVAGFAQKGSNFIGGGGDLGLPMGDFGNNFKIGFGFYAKGILGIGKAGAVTFTSGYSGYKERGLWDVMSTVNIIPLLFGYRHNFNGFFVEPQLGYAIYGSKYESEEDGTWTDSEGAINAAANIGYVFNKQIEVSLRYQTGGKQGWNVNLLGVRLGYNFSLGGSKK